MTPRPHDLLRLSAAHTLLPAEAPRPEWVEAALADTLWVVVRRAPAAPGTVPVGVRGTARGQRWPALVPERAVQRVVTPELLAAQRRRCAADRESGVPALRALAHAARVCGSWRLVWGPTGSVGFELATGHPTAGAGSDLDVLVRGLVADPRTAHAIRDELARGPARVDAQLETPHGAIALDEYARGGSVVRRTSAGPELVVSPVLGAGTA